MRYRVIRANDEVEVDEYASAREARKAAREWERDTGWTHRVEDTDPMSDYRYQTHH